MAESLEAMIIREDPDTVAAFIAEPIMGAGGVILPPKGYFEKINPILKKYDILMIADEVICGFARTGNMFGTTTFGMQPDILSCAKALSSAVLPIAGVMVNEKVFQALVSQSEKIGVFGHGYTYSGHPVASAVALETLKIYEERDILGHVGVVGPRMQAGMRRFEDHPMVGEVRGIGLIGAIEMVQNKKTRAPFDPKMGVGAYFTARGNEHGIIQRGIVDSMAFCPPLIITEDQIDEMFVRFGKALDDTYAHVKAQGWM